EAVYSRTPRRQPLTLGRYGRPLLRDARIQPGVPNRRFDMHFRVLAGATVMVGALVAATPALAGPPLLCHPYDIGTAQSLPWNETNSWFSGRPGYDVRHLISDTEELLTPETPVIVRMETLRCAVLYASQDV